MTLGASLRHALVILITASKRGIPLPSLLSQKHTGRSAQPRTWSRAQTYGRSSPPRRKHGLPLLWLRFVGFPEPVLNVRDVGVELHGDVALFLRRVKSAMGFSIIQRRTRPR